jgi:hypothetical protein
MTSGGELLYRLVPDVYRFRDTRGELYALLRNMDQVLLDIQGDIDRLYENWFIETCDEWAVPYIADLLGVKGLNPASPRTVSQRGYVANVLAYRRRKGTAAMLEQLAADHTGWAAHALEFFRLLATTQHVNHVRPQNLAWVDVRNDGALGALGSPFESAAHNVEVRSASSGRGRYNVQNVGIFLWRLESIAITRSGAVPAAEQAGQSGLFRFSVLGNDMPLFNRRRAEGDIEQLATESVVPDRLRRRALLDDRNEFVDVRARLGTNAPASSRYFGENAALCIEVNGQELPVEAICICNLSNWERPADVVPGPEGFPPESVAVDPVLGRIAFAESVAPADPPLVSYYFGFADTLGSGGYSRPPALPASDSQVVGGGAELVARLSDPALAYLPVSPEEQQRRVAALRRSVPRGLKSAPQTPAINRLEELLGKSNAHCIIEIGDSLTYSLTGIDVPDASTLEIRAADGARPVLVVDAAAELELGNDSVLLLSGLVLTGSTVSIARAPEAGVLLEHCTLVPGLGLTPTGDPEHSDQPSLVGPTEVARFDLLLHRSISGPVRLRGPLGSDHSLFAEDSIIDAAGGSLPAIDAHHASLARVTVFGASKLETLELATDCIFADSIEVEEAQEGCIRFSFLHEPSRVSEPYRCQPALALRTASAGDSASPLALAAVRARVVPAFTSTRYGEPGYAQLRPDSAPEIRRGASNEGSMGAFNFVMEPQREDNLTTSLAEYLRFGLEAGIFYVT